MASRHRRVIAISGLFTFGWTGSVLVGFVGMLNRAREGGESSGE